MLDKFDSCSAWSDGWKVLRKTLPLPIPQDIGKALLENELFSKGNDFTSPLAEGNAYVGKSTFRGMWEGRKVPELPEADSVRVWLLTKNDVPQGIITWARSEKGPVPMDVPSPSKDPSQASDTLPAAHLGGLMVYMKKEHRGQGLIRRALQAYVLPEVLVAARRIHLKDRMPFLSAPDATACLWESIAHVPVVPQLGMGEQNQRTLWDYHYISSMYPSRNMAFREFLTQPNEAPAPVQSRKMAMA